MAVAAALMVVPFGLLFLLSGLIVNVVQVIGWSMWFAEYLFLERSWAKDETTLKVFAFWSCVLSYGAFRFFKWSELLSTWKGVAISTAALLLVVVVMHIFIIFSQSERSSSARAARTRAKKD
ncbi:hypothetical protein BHE74_00010091 [Ensete ventricosum]|nr:hypothetical protein BHE74_00010091 [Ensete ventricosum]